MDLWAKAQLDETNVHNVWLLFGIFHFLISLKRSGGFIFPVSWQIDTRGKFF